MKYITRAGLIVFLLFIWIAVLIDILIGDAVTGVKRSIKQKLKDHKDQFIEIWNAADGR